MNVPSSDVTSTFGTTYFRRKRAYLAGSLEAGIRLQRTELSTIPY